MICVRSAALSPCFLTLSYYNTGWYPRSSTFVKIFYKFTTLDFIESCPWALLCIPLAFPLSFEAKNSLSFIPHLGLVCQFFYFLSTLFSIEFCNRKKPGTDSTTFSNILLLDAILSSNKQKWQQSASPEIIA